MKELSSVYPVILWQPPDKPNGVIQYYELTFTRDGQTKTGNTDDDQTYFIITKDTVPGSSGTFVVEVSWYRNYDIYTLYIPIISATIIHVTAISLCLVESNTSTLFSV